MNTRWKALDEIYKIRILLHRSDFKMSVKNRQHVFANEFNENELVFPDFLRRILQFFCETLMKI